MPGTGANTNLDPTRRQGIELEGHHKLTSSLTLDANLTWMEAQFRSGTYAGVDLSGKTVPLAPKWLANAGVTWRPTDAFLWNVSAQYVGKSRMDNDQANQFDTQLDAYVLFNTKVAYKFTRNIEGAFGINNLLDRKYATYGIRGGDASFQMLGPVANYNLYPAPGRNFYASLTVRY
ncbi:TonB-dependent receptor [Achromobacter insuavis]